MFAPDVEFVTDQPERRTYHGRGGAREAWLDFLSAWENFTVAAEDIIRGRDDRYLVLVKLRGRGKESSVPTEDLTANLVELRDGQITRFELHWDRDEARRAAGLPADE
jgi:ketosteroid isomerase-like protein